MAKHGKMESLRGRIIRVASEPRTAPRGGYLFRGIEIQRDVESGRTFLMFPIFTRKDLYHLPLLCREGLDIAAYDVRFNNELQDGSSIFTVTSESDVVLEPHRPVSVTDAIEASACIRSADLRFRIGTQEPFWMAKGKLIHALFDHLVRNPDESSFRTFEDAFKKALPELRSILPGSAVVMSQKAFENDIRTHFVNLTSWLKKNAGRFSFAEVESDRISTRWGLKGRADAVFYEKDQSTILELKSGKISGDDHILQLYAYSLLFASDTDIGLPDGYLVYSATGKSEKLTDAGDNMRRVILDGRNCLTSLKHAYTLPPETNSEQCAEFKCSRTGRCFHRSNCHKFFSASSENGIFLTNNKKEYYDHWFRLLSIEDWAQEGDFARVLDQSTLPERIDEGITLQIHRMRVVQYNWTGVSNNTSSTIDSYEITSSHSADLDSLHERDTRSGSVLAELSLLDTVVDLQPGEETILHRGDPCSNEAFRTLILNPHGSLITARLKVPFPYSPHEKLPDLTQLVDTAGWFLDRLPFSRGRQVSRRALFVFLVNAAAPVLEVVLGSESDNSFSKGIPSIVSCEDLHRKRKTRQKGEKARVYRVDARSYDLEDICFQEGLRGGLNEDQEAAVMSALNCETYHLVHGPPGTGKTRVLAQVIRRCLDRGERVLVACPTNVALDRLLISVMNLGVKNFLRIGRRSLVSPEFLETMERLESPPTLLQDLALLEMDFEDFKQHVESKALIGATAYQCAAHPLLMRQKFDRVIVDEAGQLDEPSTLGPLAHGRKFVLGGDHLQLPPIVRSCSNENSFPDPSGLERSLFERLFLCSPPGRISRLIMQYRMNREIQAIPSRLFYDGELSPSPEAATRRLNIGPGTSKDPVMNKIIDPEIPAVFVDVKGPDSGKASPEESEVVSKIVKSLLAAGMHSGEIGVITPYRAQQSLIRRSLSMSGRIDEPFPTVDTVDRFQGGEREVMIISLARSDGVTSFLGDRKRLNVALSRARSKLILLGHAPVLEKHPLFFSILEGLERVKVDSVT